MKRSSVIRLFAILLASVVSASSAYASQATLVGDAHVDSARPSTNFGYISNLNVGGGYTSLLQFDISNLPVGVAPSQIARATLTVFVNRVNTAGTVSLSPVTSAWSEAAVTSSSLPTLGNAANSFSVSMPGSTSHLTLPRWCRDGLRRPPATSALR